MKKFKKIFAVLLTLAMVLGMSISTMAAPGSVEIPIKNAGDSATYQNLQLILPDPTTETGWKFNTAEANETTILKNFQDAMGKELSDQAIIWKLIANVDATNTNIPQGTTEATADEVKNAIANVANTGYNLTEGHTAATAGIYYIKVTEPGYAYNPMAAYVSFGYTNGQPTELKVDELEAKRSEITTEKTSDEPDKITEIGRVETYYVQSVVPFVPMSDANRKYMVKDTITGAEYVLNSGKVTLSVYYNKTISEVKAGSLTADKTFDVTVADATNGGKSFEVDLTEVLENNAHANESIVITYQAKVTDVQVGNEVKIGNGTNAGESLYGSDNENLYTGSIEIEKVDEAATTVKLAGAGFIFSKTEKGSTKYAKFDTNNKFSEWTDTEIDATEVKTDTNGKLTVSGLDAGTYHITEKTAPDGYSIRDGIEDAVLELGEDKEVADGILKVSYTGDKAVKDTKLSALPSTGGIGTTIFTIGGCAIMIIAAALFFASRRRSAK